MMLSSGELSIAMNGVVDYGFTNLTDVEWMVSRLAETSPLALAVDIEDGFGGPMTVYRTCKRLARAGAHAVQLEDSSDMEDTTDLLPREQYYAKVRAAVAPWARTHPDRRTNADPRTQPTGAASGHKRPRARAETATVVKPRARHDLRRPAGAGWKMSDGPGG
jgi:hypothetical protein